MRIKRMILTALLVVAVVSFWSLQAGAYEFFSGANNCDQCHNWPSSAQHSTHTAVYSCNTCHAVEPIQPSLCAGCHGASAIFELHAPLIDQDGYQCGYCHDGVSTEQRSWYNLKNIWE